MKSAFVGVPCDIQALRKIDALSDMEWAKNVAFKIGLFCRENWAYTCFRALVEDDNGIKLEDVEKFDIKRNNIVSYLKNKSVAEFPLNKSKHYVRIGCKVCLDFSSELADISIGAIGTPAKWSTLIARTKSGVDLVEGAVKGGYIEITQIEEGKLGISLINKIASEKMKENLAEARKRQEKGTPVPHISSQQKSLENVKEDAKRKDFKFLEKEVIEAGLCIACGACEAACPGGCVKVVDERPLLEGECKKGCCDCYLLCPRTDLPLNALEKFFFESGAVSVEGIGKCIKMYAARATDNKLLERGQDGGVVTALLSYALDKGIVDDVVSVGKGELPWKPAPVISKNKEDLARTSGTVYSHSTTIPTLKYK